jgi:hypothetical protein
MLLELAALLCTGLFAGAALYVSLVEHPARLECGPALAIAQFGPSYRRGAVMQASLAGGGCLAAVAAWIQGSPTPLLVAGVLLGALIPFTLTVILPTNERLLDPRLDRNAPEATALLVRWGRLHAVRSTVGAAAFLLLVLHRGGIL